MICKCGCGQITPVAKRNRYHLGHLKGRHIDYCFAHALRGRKRIFTEEWKRKIAISRAKSGVAVGSKNPNWQGGKTALQVVIRNCFKYKEWRAKIYKRDNYTCINCGAIGDGRNLNADHIFPLSILLRRANILTIEQALEHKPLWDIGNGRTLCIDCHRQTNSYGWKAMNNYIRKEKMELAG